MAKRSKRYLEILKLRDDKKLYSPSEAIDLIKRLSNAKFDETVEVAVKLGVNPKQSDQMVRGLVTLPHGTGKSPKVTAIAKGEKAKEALEAGADLVGAEELVEKIRGGWKDFGVLVATPDLMREVAKLGKVLGPRMPNAKSGTVTMEIGRAIREIKSGQVEFRMDKTGAVVHAPLGKSSFSTEALLDNFSTFLAALIKAKPAAAKGQYIKSITLSSTMGPGVKVDPQRAVSAVGEK